MATSRRITTDDGVTLACDSAGEGPAILFLHEFAGDARDWDVQVRELSREFRCLTTNARGYPPSDVPADVESYAQDRAVADALAVLDAYGIARAHLVGHSMGSYTALHLALRYPARTASVLATGCGWGSDPNTRAETVKTCQDIAHMFRTEPMAAAAKSYASAPMRRAFHQRNPRAFDAFVARLAQHSAVGAANTMLGLQARRPILSDMAPALSRMQTPLLVVVGDDDVSCFDGSLLLKRTAPNAALMVVPRCGHQVGLEEPDMFTRTVREFVGEVEAGRWRAPR
jgi:pimeloyl-ACP methyl ester carboxylesterase